MKKPVPAPAPEKAERPSWWGLSLGDMTPEQVREAFPKAPPKPIAEFSAEELVGLKKFGPATIGGELYLAAQAAVMKTNDNRFGEAILSKSTKPVEYLSLRE